MTAALQTRELCRSFGAFRALSSVNLTLPTGARHALIGPNGAGKTTLINLLTGTLQPSFGEVFLGGDNVTRLRADMRVKRGLARTFQINTLFPDLTALETVLLAVAERSGAAGNWWSSQSRQTATTEEAMGVLASLGLNGVAGVKTRELAYGRQRLLEIALALACKPRILLLDEPAAGVPSGESVELFDAIARLPRNVTVLFIEHDMNLVFRFAERITVLVAGEILVEGTPAEIAANPKVREVYLGDACHV